MVTKKDLEQKEKDINSLLKKCFLKIEHRYNYYAIDIYQNNEFLQTLTAGLTKKQTLNLLDNIIRILILEKD
ncbi:MAG: hypothetical protein NC827_05880 [Candidatus Omnitrophica bacterium]|nr:hypothetical protein [Candidatus Omnitrophota bacterium]